MLMIYFDSGLFDSISLEYDKLNRLISAGNDVKWRENIYKIANPLNPIDIIKEKSEFFIQSYQLARKRAVLTGFDKGNQAGLTNLTDFTFPLGELLGEKLGPSPLR